MSFTDHEMATPSPKSLTKPSQTNLKNPYPPSEEDKKVKKSLNDLS